MMFGTIMLHTQFARQNCPIDTVPHDVPVEIFLFSSTLLLQLSLKASEIPQILAIFQVCRLWRQIIHQHPGFWNRLALRHTMTSKAMEKVTICLLRTKPSPFHLVNGIENHLLSTLSSVPQLISLQVCLRDQIVGFLTFAEVALLNIDPPQYRLLPQLRSLTLRYWPDHTHCTVIDDKTRLRKVIPGLVRSRVRHELDPRGCANLQKLHILGGGFKSHPFVQYRGFDRVGFIAETARNAVPERLALEVTSAEDQYPSPRQLMESILKDEGISDWTGIEDLIDSVEA